MRKAGKWIALLVVLALTVALLAACGGTTTPTTSEEKKEFKLVTPGQITVGSDTSFPPFESMKGSVAEGFDVDLMNAIGKDLGLKVVFKTETFDTLVPTLKAGGKFDVIASGMFVTDERKKSIDFTDPYGVANQAIAIKASSNFTTEADLKGKKVAAQSGTTGESWAKENLKESTIVPFKTTTDEIVALQAGNVDAAINDSPVMQYEVKDPAKGLKVMKEEPTAEQYGFGVSKDNPDLLKAMNESLKKLKDSGEYDTIYTKWFGAAPSK